MKKAIIIGAGPAGLTAAYELLTRTDIMPVILEKSGDIGGISKTINYKGNRIDIGGHRFFSKSDRVMNWWMNMMPVSSEAAGSFTISYQNKQRNVSTDPAPGQEDGADADKVMLVRPRLSRIYFLRKFFTYPIQLSIDTLRKLGIMRTFSILFSYLVAQLMPRKPEKNLEDFMINRFGKTLYRLFFKDYTEKVWGIPCDKISAEWGAQRIKGVSIRKAIEHAVQSAIKPKKAGSADIAQKETETSLIEQFLYPKFGPGQLWEEVARQVQVMGGTILMNHDVTRIYTGDDNDIVTAVVAVDRSTGETSYLEGDYFFSTMPIKELIADMGENVPATVRAIADGLQYRDFITVGILLRRLSYQDKKTGEWKPIELKDTWIYIQEKDVTVGRLQIFNNWSPFMVKDPDTVWIGMEFFCNTTDWFWNLSDEEIRSLAIAELEKIGLASSTNVLDSTVLRVEKTYPAYFGTYEHFDQVRAFTDGFANLFLVGRNGMHKYNNSDHSMLTAMVAVDNIAAGITSKANIWSINTEQEYHEEKQEAEKAVAETPASPSLTANGNQPGQEQFYRNLKDYIFRHPVHKWYALFISLAVVAQLIIFKLIYPFAGYINGDSYTYLASAYWNMDINTYPIGYPRFLRLFSVFTSSDTALVAFQYLLLMGSVMALLFTLFYFYQPAKWVKITLITLMTFNPVFPYLANYVSSDALFLSLSLVWFTQLLWIVYRPSARLIVINCFILFLAFTVRYNALYYPLVALVAFLLNRQHLAQKLAGLALGMLLIGSFVLFTGNKYRELAGKWQFSPFSGWQVANNAMYAYRYVKGDQVKKAPARFEKLDKMIRTYFDTTANPLLHPEETERASTIYMWTPKAPLQLYMKERFKGDSTSESLKKWATMAPLYRDYGTYLIKSYPMAFLKHYLWPNVAKYYAPPAEFLESYNAGIDTVRPIAQVWFGYKTNKIKTYMKTLKVPLLGLYPTFVGAMNVIFLASLAGFLFLFGLRSRLPLAGVVMLIIPLWLINFVFSVFSAPIALRMQLFPMIVFAAFSLLLLDQIIKATRE